ncbi:MAG: translational machinery protein [Actinomycetes bacterium]
MSYPHVIVWLDHHRATVIDFSIDDQHVQRVASENPVQLHRESGPMGTGRAPDDRSFVDEVTRAIEPSAEVLVVGPGTAKVSFMTDLERRAPQVAKKVVGVESADHPSDGELLAFARRYFKRIDALRGNL